MQRPKTDRKKAVQAVAGLLALPKEDRLETIRLALELQKEQKAKPANMQWIENPDHRFKTLVDVKECRKLARMARTPALEPTGSPAP